MTACRFVHWSIAPSGPPGYAAYSCSLTDGHTGPHECRSACGHPDPNYPPQEQ